MKLSWLALALLSASCVKEWRQHANWNPDPAWAHVPLTVDATAMPPQFQQSIREAEHAWSHAAGCDVLVPAKGMPADVTVSPYDGTICGTLGTTDLDTVPGAAAGASRCSSTTAEVKFREMSDVRSVFVTSGHEFGHILGLAHDRSSLMMASPQLYEPQQLSGNSGLMPLPSDADGAAVGARYCGKGK